MTNTLQSLAGFTLAVAGVWINWGAGYACLAGGLVLFISGGLAAASDQRKSRKS